MMIMLMMKITNKKILVNPVEIAVCANHTVLDPLLCVLSLNPNYSLKRVLLIVILHIREQVLRQQNFFRALYIILT